jgi:hypothetical protein
MRCWPLMVSLVAMVPPMAQAELATGIVFVDANRNGRHDDGRHRF